MNSYYKKLLEALKVKEWLGNMTSEESALLYALADYNVLITVSDEYLDNGKDNTKCTFLLNKLLDAIEKATNDYIDNACVNINHNFTGIELDKEYFDIAKERIEEIQWLN